MGKHKQELCPKDGSVLIWNAATSAFLCTRCGSYYSKPIPQRGLRAELRRLRNSRQRSFRASPDIVTFRVPTLQQSAPGYQVLIALLAGHLTAAELLIRTQLPQSEFPVLTSQLEQQGLVQRDLRLRYQLTQRGHDYLVMQNLIPAAASMAPVNPKSTPSPMSPPPVRGPNMHLLSVVLPWILILVAGIAFFAYGSSAVNQVSVTSALYSDYSIIGCGFARPSVELILVIQKPLTVAITGGTVQATIAGVQVGSGVIGFTLTNQATVDICLSGSGLASSIEKILETGHFSYALSGTVDAEFFVVISSTVPFNISGQF